MLINTNKDMLINIDLSKYKNQLTESTQFITKFKFTIKAFKDDIDRHCLIRTNKQGEHAIFTDGMYLEKDTPNKKTWDNFCEKNLLDFPCIYEFELENFNNNDFAIKLKRSV